MQALQKIWRKLRIRKKKNYVCEDKFEYENPRRKPKMLTEPHLALTAQNFLLKE